MIRIRLPASLFVFAGLLFASQACAEEPTQSKVKELQRERLVLLREMAAETTKAYQGGAASTESVHQANQAVLQAEIELCTAKTERLRLLEKAVEMAKELETRTAQIVKRKAASTSDYISAKVARLEAEIALAKEASAVDTGYAPAPVTPKKVTPKKSTKDESLTPTDGNAVARAEKAKVAEEELRKASKEAETRRTLRDFEKPQALRRPDVDDPLAYLLQGSDVVVAGEIIAEPITASTEAGIVAYVVDFKISQLIKGQEVGERRVGGTIKFSSEQFELDEGDRKPELTMGSKCVVFLTCKEHEGTLAYSAVEGFLSIQRLSKPLVKRLESLVVEPAK